MTYSRFDEAAREMAAVYADFPLDDLNLSPFTRRYVLNYRISPQALEANWLRSAHILDTALRHSHADPASACLIDCGGGQGLLSLLAVKLGFRRVVYSDLGVQMTADAKLIANRLGLAAHDYIAGDLGAVARTLQHDDTPSRVVVSSNVIEHVYNLDDLWNACTELGAGREFTAVWCSDANTSNPLRARNRRRFHRLYENVDRAPSDWESELDTRASYLSIRRSHIAALLPQENPRAVERLALATRGLNLANIDSAVSDYRRTGRMPEPEDATNTCNPETGNWCERLLKLRDIESQLLADGWQVSLDPGYYGERAGWAGRLAVRSLNALIQSLSPASLCLSPVYLLTLHKSAATPIRRRGSVR